MLLESFVFHIWVEHIPRDNPYSHIIVWEKIKVQNTKKKSTKDKALYFTILFSYNVYF